MARATQVLAVTTTLGVVASVYLFLDNRALRSELADRPATTAPAPAAPKDTVAARTGDPWTQPDKRSAKLPTGTASTEAPSLPETPKESRLDRRQRRMQEFSAMFGRHDGETDEEYRARIGPMITAGLVVPRMRVAEFRRTAEEKAGVTPEQSKQLDQAFEKVYGDVLDYTNKAVADGLLSPYERNVAGWLDYAGGLGGMLGETQGSIGKILSPEQMKAMQNSGFEWGEYLGANVPWEQLNPPPPPPK